MPKVLAFRDWLLLSTKQSKYKLIKIV